MIDHIYLPVSDLKRSSEFYRRGIIWGQVNCVEIVTNASGANAQSQIAGGWMGLADDAILDR